MPTEVFFELYFVILVLSLKRLKWLKFYEQNKYFKTAFLQQGDASKSKSKGWQQKNKGTKKASKSKKKKPLKKKPVPPSLPPQKQQKQKQANGVAHGFNDIYNFIQFITCNLMKDFVSVSSISVYAFVKYVF